jgi:ketosteroid isomerase-like protein
MCYAAPMKRLLLAALLLAAPALAQTNAELKEQVRRAETAFAKTMADRDLTAFTSFLAADSLFLASGVPARGPDAITARWKRFYDAKQKAPFSWEPEFVEVLDSGTLATSTGPVRDPSGKRIGTFNSVWRREATGQWKVILDSGCPPCPACDAK